MTTTNGLFTDIPGKDRAVSSFLVREQHTPDTLTRQVMRRVEGTPLQFGVEYLRHPEQDANGDWNCRWIERFDVTDSTGSRVKNPWDPPRTQFNMRHLLYRMQTGDIHPLLKVSFHGAFADMPDSPMVTHVERMYDVLDLDTARRDNLLTTKSLEAESGLLALIEYTTGSVLVVAAGTQVDVVKERSSSTTLIRVTPVPGGGRVRSFNGFERYDDEHASDDWLRTLADISDWSRELRRHIDAQHSPQFASWREAIKDLKERVKHDDECNNWN